MDCSLLFIFHTNKNHALGKFHQLIDVCLCVVFINFYSLLNMYYVQGPEYGMKEHIYSILYVGMLFYVFQQ